MKLSIGLPGALSRDSLFCCPDRRAAAFSSTSVATPSSDAKAEKKKKKAPSTSHSYAFHVQGSSGPSVLVTHARDAPT